MDRYRKALTNAIAVEIFIPKRLKYMGKVYSLLEDELKNRRLRPRVLGFSLSWVEGAFYGDRQIYDELTSVIRIIFDRENLGMDIKRQEATLERKVFQLMHQLAEICEGDEEQFWTVRNDIQVYKLLKKESGGSK